MSGSGVRAASLARAIFLATLDELAVDRRLPYCVELRDGTLRIGAWQRPVRAFDDVCIVSIGKAALPMARVLRSIVTAVPSWTVAGLVVSNQPAPEGWPGFECIAAEHPILGPGSMRAGERALARVHASNRERVLLLFAISGGASALCEAPIDAAISLADLQRTNELLVGCGATIGELNTVRRRLSAIKGGRLAALAPRATQVSLLWSDVNPGDVASIGSGPTVRAPEREDPAAIVARFFADDDLPRPVRECLRAPAASVVAPPDAHVEVVADNRLAIATMAKIAHERFGCRVASLPGGEQPVAAAAAELVDATRGARPAPGGIACWISGGEAICPVRGPGRGGRNQETVLLAALSLAAIEPADRRDIAFLAAGTDGVDGNSPATGAVADRTSVARGLARGLDPRAHLASSDSYSWFAALGDTILTGPTGNNLRDLRCTIVCA